MKKDSITTLPTFLSKSKVLLLSTREMIHVYLCGGLQQERKSQILDVLADRTSPEFKNGLKKSKYQ